ncbi:MAG: glycosyltransferase family 9 protein [Nitrospirae bacterium]|nr:glycosyltransferase family 9 protein [Nitrospirota bacterium]
MFYVLLAYISKPIFSFFAALRKKGKLSRILVIQTAKIGDVICSTPVFRAIREKFPAGRVTAIVSPVAEKLLANCPHLDDVFAIDNSSYKGLGGKLRLAALIRRGRYDAAVCLNPNVPFAVALLWGLVPVRLTVMPDYCGLTFKTASLLFTRLEKHAAGSLLAETYLNLLKELGIKNNGLGKEVYPAERADRAAEGLLGRMDAELIGIGAGSGNRMKELGSDKIARLTNIILERTGAAVVLIGSVSDIESAKKISGSVSDKERVINAVGKLELDLLPALIKRLSLFIGVDSGITYMADALSIPLINIAGPSDMNDQRPLGANAVIIQNKLPCVPCSHAFSSPYTCRLGTRECVTSVSAEEIFSAVEKLLRRAKD